LVPEETALHHRLVVRLEIILYLAPLLLLLVGVVAHLSAQQIQQLLTVETAVLEVVEVLLQRHLLIHQAALETHPQHLRHKAITVGLGSSMEVMAVVVGLGVHQPLEQQQMLLMLVMAGTVRHLVFLVPLLLTLAVAVVEGIQERQQHRVEQEVLVVVEPEEME
jgi:hypothetical protein